MGRRESRGGGIGSGILSFSAQKRREGRIIYGPLSPLVKLGLGVVLMKTPYGDL